MNDNDCMRDIDPGPPRKPKAPVLLKPVCWKKLSHQLKKFKKNFLNESETCKYSDEAIKNYYDKAEARVHSRSKLTLINNGSLKVYCPFFDVSETPFPQSMQDQYRSEGFADPLPLHAISWPYILSGQNFVGTAQCDRDVLIHTFALPALLHVQHRIRTAGVDEEQGPFAVILTDLKTQGVHIIEKLKAYGEPLSIKCHLISGGCVKHTENNPMVMGLKQNPHIVVACLGGEDVHNMLLSNKLNLKQCTFLVLDDGRRLMKYSILLKDILGQMRPDRQIVLWNSEFSNIATSSMVHTLLDSFKIRDYSRVFFGSMAHFTEPNAVKHVVMAVTNITRRNRFVCLIQSILASFADPSSQRKAKFLIYCNKPSIVVHVLSTIGLSSHIFVKPKDVANLIAASSLTDKPVTDDEKDADEMEEACDVEGAADVTLDKLKQTPRERFDLQMRNNPNIHFWLACPAAPLEYSNFSDFDFLINFDIPSEKFMKHFRLRSSNFTAGTGGKGTIYSFILDTDEPWTLKILAKFLQGANQYVPPFLYETQPKEETANDKPAPVAPKATKVNPNQLKSRQPNEGHGPIQRNRFVRPDDRAKPYGSAMRRSDFNLDGKRFECEPRNYGANCPGGDFGSRPSNNFGNSPSGNHYGESEPADSFRRESRNNRLSGGRNDDMLDAPNSKAGILDAMKLISQLKEQLLDKPATPYGRGGSPPPVNNFFNDTAYNEFPADNVRPANKWGGFYGMCRSPGRNSRDRSESIRNFNSMDNDSSNQRRFGNYPNSNWSNSF